MCWAAAYAGIFCYIYINYLNVVYSAEDYSINDRATVEFAISLLLAIVPIAFYSFSRAVSQVMASLIYSLYYVPSVLVIHYALDRSYAEVFTLQASLAITMCGLFVASKYPKHTGESEPIPRFYRKSVFGLSILMLAAVVATYRDHMRLVSLDEVYDLRFENNEIEKSVLIGYFVMQLSYCFLPFALARAFLYKEKGNLLLGLAGCVVIYASTGARISIFTPFILGGFYALMKWKGDLLRNILLTVTVASALVIILLPDNNATLLLKSIFFVRVLAVSGWATYKYYVYFSTHPVTYLSQIGVVNDLTGRYPFGSHSLGEIFAEVPGQSMNAGFWASEGLASFGIYGIYIASILLAILLVALNQLTRKLDWAFAVLWMCGFAMAMLNLPLSTLMLSAGGFLILGLLIMFRVKPPALNHRPEHSEAEPEPPLQT